MSKKKSKKTSRKKTKPRKASQPKKRKAKKDAPAAWGPKITIGVVLDADLTVKEPLNKAALAETTTLSGVTLIFHERLTELEKRVAQLED